MSSAAMKWAAQQTVQHPGLSHLLSILSAVADKRGQTWRSQLTLAQQMAVTERCVRKYLRALERLGVVQRAHRSNGRGGRTSDLIRLRLDRQFTITKEAARAILQPEQRSGKNPSSYRNNTPFQPEPRSGEKGSDQQKEVIYQEEHPQDSQSAQRAEGGERPSLRVIGGGRA
jgi:hypothetical protein